MTRASEVVPTEWVDSLERRCFKTGWRRVAAAFVDTLVLWPLDWVEWGLIQLRADGVVAVSWVLFRTVLGVGYYLGAHAVFGATVGKAAMRVRVVALDGSVPGWKRAALRDIVVLFLLPYTIVISLPTAWDGLAHLTQAAEPSGAERALGTTLVLWFLLELLTMLFNRRRRALHDFIAGTVVIRTDVGRWPTSPIEKGRSETAGRLANEGQ